MHFYQGVLYETCTSWTSAYDVRSGLHQVSRHIHDRFPFKQFRCSLISLVRVEIIHILPSRWGYFTTATSIKRDTKQTNCIPLLIDCTCSDTLHTHSSWFAQLLYWYWPGVHFVTALDVWKLFMMWVCVLKNYESRKHLLNIRSLLSYTITKLWSNHKYNYVDLSRSPYVSWQKTVKCTEA